KTVPVVGLRYRIPRPIRRLKILEDDSCIPILVRGVAPDIEVPPTATRFRPSGSLEPHMLVRCVIQYELGDHLDPAPVRFSQELLEIAQAAVGRVHIVVVSNVVAIIL